jgi:quercetin dioxygenase-like cupin family protein
MEISMKHLKLVEAPRLEPVKGALMALIGDGERMTMIRMEIQPGAIVPDHDHPNEQIGTCVEGTGTLTSGGESVKVEPGVAWVIPADELHSFEADKNNMAVLIEAWNPPREDYKAMARPAS